MAEQNPKRASKEEKEQRIQYVMTLVKAGFDKCEIKRRCRKKYDITWKQAERYLSIARERLRAEIEQDKPELQASSYGYYMDMARNKRMPPRCRLEARKAADRLLGLREPQRVELQGTSDNLRNLRPEDMTFRQLAEAIIAEAIIAEKKQNATRNRKTTRQARATQKQSKSRSKRV